MRVSLQQRTLENVETVACAKMYESCVSPQFCAGTAGYGVGGVGTIPLGGGQESGIRTSIIIIFKKILMILNVQ